MSTVVGCDPQMHPTPGPRGCSFTTRLPIRNLVHSGCIHYLWKSAFHGWYKLLVTPGGYRGGRNVLYHRINWLHRLRDLCIMAQTLAAAIIPLLLPSPSVSSRVAMLFRCTIHPHGLDPFQAAKAWQLRTREKLSWRAIRLQVRTVSGGRPGRKALTHGGGVAA